MIPKWIKRLFGWRDPNVHVCEEFTRWHRRKVRIGTTYVDQWGLTTSKEPVWEDVIIQERECTICGKLQQERLNL